MIKYDFLDVGLAYRPKYKCGAESMIIPAAITGGAGLFGSLFSSRSAAANNANALSFSMAENEKQRAWQEKMYGLQHSDMLADTINSEKRSNYEYDRRQALALESMKDMSKWIQQNYASPAAQAKAMRVAGFNPAMMLGAGGQGFGSAVQSAPQVAPPASHFSPVSGMSSPLMGVPSLQNQGQLFSEGIESLSRSVANVVQADKTSEETRRLRATFDSYTSTALAEKVSAQAAAESAQLRLALDKLNLPKKYDLEIRKLQQDITNAVIFGDYQQAQTAYTDMQTKLSDIAQKKGSIDLDYYRQQWEQHFQHISSQIALNESAKLLNKANAVQSYASAENLKAKTKTEDAIRKWKVDLEHMNSLIAKSDNTIKQASVQAEIEMLANRAVASGLANAETQERIQVLIKEKNWYELNKLLNGLGAGAVVGALVK